MALPAITFSDECDSTSLFNMMYVMKEWFVSGPVFRWYVAHNVCYTGTYEGDDGDEEIIIRLMPEAGGGTVTVRLSSITRIEYL